jgi:hypothetical protein
MDNKVRVDGIEIDKEVVDTLIEAGIIESKSDLLDKFGVDDLADAGVTAFERLIDGFTPQGQFEVTAYDPQGNVKWQEAMSNIVVNVGLDYALDTTLNGATQSTTWYVGLVDGATSPTFDAGDTISSHSGWSENTDYSESARQTWSNGAVSSQSIDNSGSPAAFSINASTDVAGAFLVDDSTKGGTSGTLFAEGSFSGGTRSLQNGDSLEVTYTINAS